MNNVALPGTLTRSAAAAIFLMAVGNVTASSVSHTLVPDFESETDVCNSTEMMPGVNANVDMAPDADLTTVDLCFQGSLDEKQTGSVPLDPQPSIYRVRERVPVHPMTFAGPSGMILIGFGLILIGVRSERPHRRRRRSQ